jgi:hypothetical protein
VKEWVKDIGSNVLNADTNSPVVSEQAPLKYDALNAVDMIQISMTTMDKEEDYLEVCKQWFTKESRCITDAKSVEKSSPRL